MDLKLDGEVAIVTGGASNIGRATVLTLAAEGAKVMLADVDDVQARKVLAAAEGLPGAVDFTYCDVTDRVASEALVARTAEVFGAPGIMINNVGWAEHKLFVEKDWEIAEREIAINFWGSLYATRAVLPQMIENGGGRIICVSSDAGKTGEYRETIYSAAKAGIMGFVRALAREVGRHGITVNGVCPSMTLPEDEAEYGQMSMHHARDWSPERMEKILKRYPMRRVGRPADVADFIAFLASGSGSFITGQNISVNGGYTM